MLLNLALLDYPLVAKPSSTIETLGDAIEFLARLTPEVRAQLHWHRAIHSVGAAIKEPRYVTVATLNLQMALAMDHLLLSDPPANPQRSEPPGQTCKTLGNELSPNFGDGRAG
jgi:hypothetical protein